MIKQLTIVILITMTFCAKNRTVKVGGIIKTAPKVKSLIKRDLDDEERSKLKELLLEQFQLPLFNAYGFELLSNENSFESKLNLISRNSKNTKKTNPRLIHKILHPLLLKFNSNHKNINIKSY